MAQNVPTENRDWLIPAVLVAVAVVLGLIVGVAAVVRAPGQGDDAVVGQLERWSSCLRSEGANVPLVESVRGGGFRLTVDASLLDGGLDREALGSALDACEDEAPESVRRLTSLVRLVPRSPLGHYNFFDFDSDGAHGFPSGWLERAPDRRDHGHRDISGLCEFIENGGADEQHVQPRPVEACRNSS